MLRVIVLLNGPFGVGKSSVAGHLAAMTDAVIVDPELMGPVAREATDGAASEDFQVLPIWRHLVLATIAETRLLYPDSLVIVPMALWRPEVRQEIVDGLRAIDTLRIFVLTASEETLRSRILGDPLPGAREWRLAHVTPGLAAFGTSTEGRTIRTDDVGPGTVAGTILQRHKEHR